MIKRMVTKATQRGSLFQGVLGIFLGIVVFVSFWLLAIGGPYLLEKAGEIYMFLPEKFGMVKTVAPEEVLLIDSVIPHETTILLAQPGDYAILLMEDFNSPPGITIISVDNGEHVDVFPLELWSDQQVQELDLVGQPHSRFFIEQSGAYRIALGGFPEGARRTVTILPDRTKENRTLLNLACLTQNIFLFTVIGAIYYWRNKDRLVQQKTAKENKRSDFEKWLHDETQPQGD